MILTSLSPRRALAVVAILVPACAPAVHTQEAPSRESVARLVVRQGVVEEPWATSVTDRSADGAVGVTRGRGSSLLLWNARTGDYLGTVPTGTSDIRQVRLSPRGRYLLVSGGSGLELIDLRTRRSLGDFRPDVDQEDGVFSRGDNALLTWSSSQACVHLWLLEDLSKRTFGAEQCDGWQSGRVRAAAFSPDGGRILLAGDSALEIWDRATLRPVERTDAPRGFARAAAFAPSGREVVVAFDDRLVVWHWEDGGMREVQVEGLRPSSLEITHEAHPRDLIGWMRIGDRQGTFLFHPESGEVVREEERQTGSDHLPWWLERSPPDRITHPEGLEASPTAPMVVTKGRERPGADGPPPADHLYAWSLVTGRPLWRLSASEHHASDLDFSPDGSLLAAASYGEPPVLLNTRSGGRVRALADSAYPALHYSPGGERILLWGRGRPLMVEAATGRLLRELPFRHGGPISPDGSLLAAVAGNVYILDLEEDSLPLLQEIGPYRGRKATHGPQITATEFHPDGDRILTSGWILRPTLYEVATGDTAGILPTPRPTSTEMVSVSATLSPDGRYALSRAESGKDALLWYIERPHPDSWRGWRPDPDLSRYPELRFKGDEVITGAVFSGDGRMLVTTHTDGSTRVWSLWTGDELYRRYLIGEEDWVVLTPDGRFDGTPGGIAEVRRIHGTSSISVDADHSPRVEGLVEEVVREAFGSGDGRAAPPAEAVEGVYAAVLRDALFEGGTPPLLILQEDRGFRITRQSLREELGRIPLPLLAAFLDALRTGELDSEGLQLPVPVERVTWDEVEALFAEEDLVAIWDAFHDAYPGSDALVALSPVGIGPRGEEALVAVYEGWGPMGCRSRIFRLRRDPGWAVVEQARLGGC